MTLARDIYALTKCFPKTEVFRLTSQIRRAAVSVPSNIAEGTGRLTDKSFIVFLGQARGSLFELQTQMELAASLGFIDSDRARQTIGEAGEIASMLHALLPGFVAAASSADYRARLPATHYRLPTPDYRPPDTDYRLLTTDLLPPPSSNAAVS